MVRENKDLEGYVHCVGKKEDRGCEQHIAVSRVPPEDAPAQMNSSCRVCQQTSILVLYKPVGLSVQLVHWIGL